MDRGCGDGGGESGDGGAASVSPRVEEPPPVPPAASLQVPTNVSPTADSWEAEADDALLTPEDNNEQEEEELDQQVGTSHIENDDGEMTKKDS